MSASFSALGKYLGINLVDVNKSSRLSFFLKFFYSLIILLVLVTDSAFISILLIKIYRELKNTKINYKTQYHKYIIIISCIKKNIWIFNEYKSIENYHITLSKLVLFCWNYTNQKCVKNDILYITNHKLIRFV